MSPKDLRVLYFGDPLAALHLLDRGVTLCGVVHGRRGGPGWQRLVPRLRGVPRWQLPNLDDPAVLAQLRATAPDLLVSGFYPRQIPEGVLALAPGYNVHPSDLPRWRGPDPSWWVVRSGETHTAICVHELSAGLDEGAVIDRWPVAVGPEESAGHLAVRLEALAQARLAEIIARMAAGERFEPQPQVGAASWAPLVDPQEMEIDWRASAVEVARLVRAAAPDPGAFTGIGDELLIVLAGRAVPAGHFKELAPGQTFVRGGFLCVRTGDAPPEAGAEAPGAYQISRARLGRRLLGGRALARLLL